MRVLGSQMLFDDWSPVTHDFGLIDAPLDSVVAGLARWHESLGIACAREERHTLAAALEALLPLSNARTRSLYVMTRSGWTAYFQNGIQGSDPFPAMSFLALQLGVIAMRICHSGDKPYPATIWEVYAPEPLGGQPPLGYRRSIAVANDGGRWVFEQSGDPFPFEEIEAYAAPRKPDRFTAEMLARYLRVGFGLEVFDEAFYVVSRSTPAVVLRQTTKLPRLPEYSLHEVKAGVPWRR